MSLESHPDTSYQVFMGLSVNEKVKIDFQDGHHGSYIGFLIRRFLSISELQVTPMIPTKWPPWISDWYNFSYFSYTISHPLASYQVSSQLAFQFRRISKKEGQDGPVLDYQINWPFCLGEV